MRIAAAIALLACLTCHGQQINWWKAISEDLPIPPQPTCATSDSPLAGDELKYGYESGDTGTWATWTGVAVLTWDEAYSTSLLTTGKPTGACNVGGHYIVSTTSGNESRYLDLGAALTYPVDINFYLYVESMADAANFIFFVPGNSAAADSSIALQLYLRFIAGTYSVLADGATSSSALNLTASSWNKITLHLDATAANCTLNVNDGGSPASFERTAQSVRYLHFGAPGGHGPDESATYDLDLICVNTP